MSESENSFFSAENSPAKGKSAPRFYEAVEDMISDTLEEMGKNTKGFAFSSTRDKEKKRQALGAASRNYVVDEEEEEDFSDKSDSISANFDFDYSFKDDSSVRVVEETPEASPASLNEGPKSNHNISIEGSSSAGSSSSKSSRSIRSASSSVADDLPEATVSTPAGPSSMKSVFGYRNKPSSGGSSSSSSSISAASSPNDSDVQLLPESASIPGPSSKKSDFVYSEADSFSDEASNHSGYDFSESLSSKSDSDIEVLTEKIKKLPLGEKRQTGAGAARRAIFLDDPPPIDKKVYAYDPLNAKHQEFYGDVQRTVTKLAETIERMPMPDDGDDVAIPKGLVSLYDHQRYGLRWLSWREREFPGGGILADEMGLGKTIMTIALIMKCREERREAKENWVDTKEMSRRINARTTLVVCPLGCMLQWQEEIINKGRGLKVYVFHGPERKTSAAYLAQQDVVLTTYQTLGSELPKDKENKSKSVLDRLYFERVVLDEAHTIRNPKTLCAQAAYKLEARHRWAVTGTPVHNKPEDFFSMVKFLRMVPFDDPKVWDNWIGLKNVKKSKEAQERLHTIGKALILRRTKLEVQTQGGNVRAIPPKVVEVVDIELNEEERRVYDYLKEYAQQKFKDFMLNQEQRQRDMQAAAFSYTANAARGRKKNNLAGDGGDIQFSHLFALIVRMRQCAVLPHLISTMLEDEDVEKDASFDELDDSHIISKRNPCFNRLYKSSKIQRILDDLEALKDEAEAEDRPMDKVVIVSSWTSTLQILYDHLRKSHLSAVFITGKEKVDERMDAMKKFNTYPGRPEIVLLSLAAGGVGLNLIGGNHVFFVEPHWNPQLELQAQDRVHRFGQTKNVLIRRYISKSTIEDRIMELQKMKVDLADGVLKNTKKSGGGLSIPQMRLLFENP